MGAGQDGRKQRRGLRDGGGDEQHIDGFILGEKEAAGRGIGDGDGAAVGDLAGKGFNHAVARSEHIAEAENGSTGGQDDLLGDSFGCAHY